MPPGSALLFNHVNIYEDSSVPSPFNTLKVEKLSELRLKTGPVGVLVGQRACWHQLVHGSERQMRTRGSAQLQQPSQPKTLKCSWAIKGLTFPDDPEGSAPPLRHQPPSKLSVTAADRRNQNWTLWFVLPLIWI